MGAILMHSHSSAILMFFFIKTKITLLLVLKQFATGIPNLYLGWQVYVSRQNSVLASLVFFNISFIFSVKFSHEA